MDRTRLHRCLTLIFTLTSLLQFADAQTSAKKDTKPALPTTKELVVNGHGVDAGVLQIDGHSYVDMEAFAQATGASISVESSRIVMTLPVAAPTAQAPARTSGLSRAFAQAGIASVSDMREWRGGIASVIRFGVAAGNWLGPWLQDYQVRAQKSYDQAALAAKTPADRKATELLRNELTNVKQWDTQTQAAIQSLNAEPAVNPSATDNDPLRIKIADCSSFLASMLVSGEFADNANCH